MDNTFAPSRPVGLMSYKVLVVDDSRLARMAVSKLLGDTCPDWTLVEAANADDALALMEGKEVDIVVLDFNMPGRDGFRILPLSFAREGPRCPWL